MQDQTDRRQDPSSPPARLALSDGSIHRGRAFGAIGRGIIARGELVFNTAMTGYQESLTDPSYEGQVLVGTAPLVGNTGANVLDMESPRVRVAGFVVHELARRASNYRSESSLSALLERSGTLGVEGVDTRALTRRIRSAGTLPCALTDDLSVTDAALVEHARSAPTTVGADLASAASREAGSAWDQGRGEWGAEETRGGLAPGAGPVVLAIDGGVKDNILRHLVERGCTVRLVPASIGADELVRIIESGEVDGLFLSNGPGDPAAVGKTVGALRTVLVDRGLDIPTFGICLGHQLLALAMGAETYKLPFGHRGANQPVVEVKTGTVAITSQNHGYAVEPGSLERVGGVVTHTHLNDGTVAGFECAGGRVFGVQFHPEASPGPHEAGAHFDRFVALMVGDH